MTVGLQTRSPGGPTTTETRAFRILLLTDDDHLVEVCRDKWSSHRGTLEVANDRESWNLARRATHDAVLLDGSMGISWADEVLETCRDSSELMVLAPSDDAARWALDHGAAAVIRRPCTGEEIVAAAEMAAESRRLRRQIRALETRLNELESDDELVGCSPVVRRLMGAVSKAGENDATVLIEGQAGAGKTLVARLIHSNGNRSTASLEVFRGDSLDEQTLETALRDGGGGTLVIEDVEKTSNACQSRLVRYLKERRSGGRDVRIIATTTARLAELTAKGAFREDLYYRLNVFPIVVPTLKERREDIPLLAAHFLAEASRREGLPDRGFTPGAMIMIEAHPWPGNVAQLRNAVSRALSLAEGGAVDRVHLFGPSTGVNPPPGVNGLTDKISGEEGEDDLTEDDVLPFHEEEKRILTRALQATQGNVRRAAQLLGIGRATLYRKIQVYQLRLQ